MAALPNSEELWAVREYLRTSGSPDCEFVDGRIDERNLGEKEHSIIQRLLTVLFWMKRNEWQVEAFPELRTQTQPRRFRVPDVLVTRAEGKFDRYIGRPPQIAIEILSPEDTITALRAKASGYRQFGIEHIRIIEPEPRIAFRYVNSSLEEVQNGELSIPNSPIRIVLSEMFAELDRA